MPEQSRGEFLRSRNTLSPKGTLLAARNALEVGIGINLGGGYHHAKPDSGEGFCIFADIPIAIRQLQAGGYSQDAWKAQYQSISHLIDTYGVAK